MADPLSLAASIAGLLALSGKICTTLSDFVSGVIDAPDSARVALAVVDEMRLALESIKQLVDTVSTLPSKRKALLRIDHIAITFSNCILSLSELESLVCFKDGLMHRLRWVWGEKKVFRLLPRLESQKASLSLMVMVLRCQSEIEALQGRERLNAAVNQILQQNEEFAARLQRLEGTCEIEDRSVRFFDGDSTAEPRRESIMITYMPEGPSGSSDSSSTASQAQISNAETSLSNLSLSEPESTMSSFSRHEFETVLEKSRVYMGTKSNEPDRSFTSSATRSHAWSMLSLNDISIVAVFRLPITLDDVNSFGPGLTFGALLQEQALEAASSQQATVSSLTNAIRPPENTNQTRTKQAWEVSIPVSPSEIPATERNGTLDKKAAAKQSRLVADKPVVPTIKLVVVGDKATHQNETLISYTTGVYPEEWVHTFGTHAVTVMIGDDLYTLGLVGMAGQEDYSRLRPLSYPQTDVFLVLARIGNPYTYDSVEGKWVPEIKHFCPGVPFIIVGIMDGINRDGMVNKAARIGDHKALGEAMANRLGAVKYMECDISTNYGVNNVFDEVIVAALEPPAPRRKRKVQRWSWRPSFLDAVTEKEEEQEQ